MLEGVADSVTLAIIRREEIRISFTISIIYDDFAQIIASASLIAPFRQPFLS